MYDLELMVKSTGADGGWKAVPPGGFPAGGITVTLPYPEGTGRDTHEFTVVRMITTGPGAGKTEPLAVTKTKDGLQFKVSSLSPVAVGWKEVEQDTPADTGKPASGNGNNSAGPGTQAGGGSSPQDSGNAGNQDGSGQGADTGTGNGASTSNSAGTSKNMSSVNSGDESHVALYALLFLAAGGMLLCYAARRKKGIL